MREVKLKYTDKETAIADLMAKGIQVEVEDTMSFAGISEFKEEIIE